MKKLFTLLLLVIGFGASAQDFDFACTQGYEIFYQRVGDTEEVDVVVMYNRVPLTNAEYDNLLITIGILSSGGGTFTNQYTESQSLSPSPDYRWRADLRDNGGWNIETNTRHVSIILYRGGSSFTEIANTRIPDSELDIAFEGDFSLNYRRVNGTNQVDVQLLRGGYIVSNENFTTLSNRAIRVQNGNFVAGLETSSSPLDGFHWRADLGGLGSAGNDVRIIFQNTSSGIPASAPVLATIDIPYVVVYGFKANRISSNEIRLTLTGDGRVLSADQARAATRNLSLNIVTDGTSYGTGSTIRTGSHWTITRRDILDKMYSRGFTAMVQIIGGDQTFTVRASDISSMATSANLRVKVDGNGGIVNSHFRNQYNEVHWSFNGSGTIEYRIIKGRQTDIESVTPWMSIWDNGNTGDGGFSDEFSGQDSRGYFVASEGNLARSSRYITFGDNRIQLRVIFSDGSIATRFKSDYRGGGVAEVNAHRHHTITTAGHRSFNVCGGQNFQGVSDSDHTPAWHLVGTGTFRGMFIRGGNHQAATFSREGANLHVFLLNSNDEDYCDVNPSIPINSGTATAYRLSSARGVIARGSLSGNNWLGNFIYGEAQGIGVGDTVKLVDVSGNGYTYMAEVVGINGVNHRSLGNFRRQHDNASISRHDLPNVNYFITKNSQAHPINQLRVWD